MAQVETAKTITYTGRTTEEVERTYASEQQEAQAAGYHVVTARWDTTQLQPTLVVDYALRQPASQAAATPTRTSRPAVKRATPLQIAIGVVLAAITFVVVGAYLVSNPDDSGVAEDRDDQPARAEVGTLAEVPTLDSCSKVQRRLDVHHTFTDEYVAALLVRGQALGCSLKMPSE